MRNTKQSRIEIWSEYITVKNTEQYIGKNSRENRTVWRTKQFVVETN